MSNRFNNRKRRGSPSGNESDNPKRHKASSIEGGLPKIGENPSSETMRGLKLYLAAEAGKIGGMYQLQLFKYAEVEAKKLVEAQCQEGMPNPYSLAAAYGRNLGTEKENEKMQSKINDWEVNIITRRGEVKKKLKDEHLGIQQKMIAMVLGTMIGHMKEAILRWVSENSTSLENPHFQGVYHLVEHLFNMTGVASSDLYNSTKRELLAMEFKDEGPLPVTMFYSKLLGKTEDLNNQASKDSEKITTNAALLELIFNAFCKSKILKESVSKIRNSWAEVERDIKGMKTGLTTVEEFERLYMITSHSSNNPVPEYQVEDVNTTLRGRLEKGGSKEESSTTMNLSPRSIISGVTGSGHFPTPSAAPSRFAVRDSDGLNESDRAAINQVELVAREARMENLRTMGTTVETVNSSNLNLTQKTAQTANALQVQRDADQVVNNTLTVEIARIKAAAVNSATQEGSTLEEEALGVEYMRTKEQLISSANTAKLEALLPMTAMPVTMSIADRENVMLTSTNAVNAIDLKLVNDLSLLRNNREASLRAAREAEERSALMEPLQRQISALQMKVEEQTKASAHARMSMLLQLQVDSIKKALLKLTPTQVINDFQQFFNRMQMKSKMFCNHCRTSTHNTVECRVKKEQREQALLAGGRAKMAQREQAAKAAKSLAEKRAEYLKTVECHHCHKIGHFKNQCPSLNAAAKPSKKLLGGAEEAKEEG